MKNSFYELNKQQTTAVMLPLESALVLAGAGSGKTRVLTARIAWLVQTKQISPERIVAVTFTNKASKEMFMRLSAIKTINIHNMWIGTFHGLCHRLLRFHHQEADLPSSFQILSIQDQLLTIKRLFKTFDIDSERYLPCNLMHFINRAKEKGWRAKNIDIKICRNKKFVELYDLYDQQCQREGVVDFAELLLRTHELLSTNIRLRVQYQLRFRCIFVDEFQDINNLQYKWLKLIASHGQKDANIVFAVGDDDQSIYGFRGANINNIENFRHDFRVQHLIKLEENYRSDGYILDAANMLIAHNHRRLGKNLHTNAKWGEKICVFESSSDSEEAKWIVEQIKNLIDNQDKTYGQIAILYRSSAQSRVLEHALFNAGIAYFVHNGQRFFERAEIRNAIAYLQLIDNPHNNVAFSRVVNFPVRGIGVKTLEYLQNLAYQRNCSLYAAVSLYIGKGKVALHAFVAFINNMRSMIQTLPLQEIVKLVLNTSGLSTFYADKKNMIARTENLSQLVNVAAAFLADKDVDMLAHNDSLELLQPQIMTTCSNALLTNTLSSLSAFLSHIALETNIETIEGLKKNYVLKLMTVHAAKGLEFNVVFITGLEEGLFPHENSLHQNETLEEERRLMYVAITRARRRLYMSFSQTRMLNGYLRQNVRSRFFSELPIQSINWLLGQKIYPRMFLKPQNTNLSKNFLIDLSNINTKNTFSSKITVKWQIGEHVLHTKFGQGVIMSIQHVNNSIHAYINFNQLGVKLLDLNVAQLSKLF